MCEGLKSILNKAGIVPTRAAAILDVIGERTFHMKTLAFTIGGFPNFFSIFKDSPLREMLCPQIIV
jgi:hypothetical protein